MDLDWLEDTPQTPDLEELEKLADFLSEQAAKCDTPDESKPVPETIVPPKEVEPCPPVPSIPEAKTAVSVEPFPSDGVILITVPSTADGIYIEDAVEEVVSNEEEEEYLVDKTTSLSPPSSFASDETDMCHELASLTDSDHGYESLDSPVSDGYESLQQLFPELL
jgi:hypothetical protein